MNNFNKVFLVIKKHCQDQKRIAEIDCFEAIAREANVPMSRLPLYLHHLQEAGLIKYSIAQKYIHLTLFGKQHDTLIKSET
jgi:predicted transcriptional regulator